MKLLLPLVFASALVAVPTWAAVPSHLSDVERRLLAEARQGAERHRKGDAALGALLFPARPAAAPHRVHPAVLGQADRRRLERLVNEEWRTAVEAKTDGAGQTTFRGCYGRYAVTLRETDGTVHAFTVFVSKKTGQQNRFRLTVQP